MKLKDAKIIIENQTEARTLEFKGWITLADPNGKAKVVKCLQALHNYNGGHLVIGIDDKTRECDTHNPLPKDVENDYHKDKIQALVAEHSSYPFEVDVLFPEINGQKHPFIAVSPGVRAPVAVKRRILDKNNSELISCDDVYFRTLASNNTVSTAKIPHKDWPEIIRICLHNHEADIGRFLKRHLTPETIKSFCGGFSFKSPDASMDEIVLRILDEGRKRYKEVVAKRSPDLPSCGSFEVGLAISGQIPSYNADRSFQILLDRNNPQLTGWPIWLDSSGFHKEDRPYVMCGGWEALILSLNDELVHRGIDFMQKKPIGHFYLLRGLQDDLTRSARAPQPNTQLDFGLTILRTAEAIAVGKAFALALSCDPEETQLEFGFRWSGLSGRVLTSWASPERSLYVDPPYVRNEIDCRTTVPLSSSPNSIAEFTNQVVSKVFALFDGYETDPGVVEDLVVRLLERRL